MKFIPYSRLQSENLIVLLYVARLLAVIGGVWSIVGSIVLLVISGICAAVVSFEQTYTQKHTSPTAEGVTK
ncbi:hypothetical protein IDAT_11220 [Pseudidiomarina atlantica]|uniref:Uncharacterized protein n=2 Tax=Pseudidiomarina atlantica TaxID=1517416 RepID=A0A094L0L8_9GAMM|nr:hypothetical protein IDAT_11220 [Pseudidiomarina atlantica]